MKQNEPQQQQRTQTEQPHSVIVFFSLDLKAVKNMKWLQFLENFMKKKPRRDENPRGIGSHANTAEADLKQFTSSQSAKDEMWMCH